MNMNVELQLSVPNLQEEEAMVAAHLMIVQIIRYYREMVLVLNVHHTLENSQTIYVSPSSVWVTQY